MSQKVIDLIYLSIYKEDQTNPKLSNETYFEKTKKTLKEGFEHAIENYKKENPMWAGTLNYFLELDHSKKNIEEYFWI